MGGGRKRSRWVKTMWQGAGIGPFMPGWVLGMLTVNSANLARAGSHADTGRMETEKSLRCWGMIGLGPKGLVASWTTGG